MWCAYCGITAKTRDGLCTACLCKAVDFATGHMGSIEVNERKASVYSLYDYQGIIRQLILAAKIGRDPLALKAVTGLLVRCVAVDAIIRWADCLIPVASSFSGRLKSQYDLPAHWAWYFGKYERVQIGSAPLPFLLQKGKYRPRLKQWLLRLPGMRGAVPSHCRKVLLLDDVVTTGRTLSNTIRTLGDEVETRCLVLSASRSFVKKY